MSNRLQLVPKQIRFPFLVQKSHVSSNQANDLIGPVNPVSNLRPVKFAVRENETKLEKKLRLEREELQLWNEEFWTKHNKTFLKEKEEYIKSEVNRKGNSEQSLSPDEMSVFYKNFLDKNWKTHFYYNVNWHRKNFYVTFLDFQVRLEKLINKFR